MSDLLNDLLTIYNNTTVIIDFNTNNVKESFLGSHPFLQNVTYQEFSDAFCKKFNYDDESNEKLVKFLNNLNFKDAFEIKATYKTNDDNLQELHFNGKLHNDKLVFVISNSLEKYNQQLDSLTKVLNHESIILEAKELIKNKTPFILMMIDVDDFKLFNDNFGHIYGDIVLVDLAATLKQVIKDHGNVGRIGGDEFLVLYKTDTSNFDSVYSICSNLKKDIITNFNENLKDSAATVTIGVSLYPNDSDTYEDLFTKADSALYKGKRKGRNCFVIYDKTKLSDFIANPEKKISVEELHQYSNHANIIAGIFELLMSNKDNYNTKFNNSLKLILNYFLFDRVTLFTNEFVNNKPVPDQIICYTESSKVPLIDEPLLSENIEQFRKLLHEKDFIKIVQVKSNPTFLVYNTLIRQKTSATLMFLLQNNGKEYGVLRFDMCSTNRFWHVDEISALMLISKLFSITLHTSYEEKLIDKQLHYDAITQIYNYSKWRTEVNNVIDYNKKYSLISINIVNFTNLNYTKGTEYCDNVLLLLARSIKQNMGDTIYCRFNKDNFLIYLNTVDKMHIINCLDTINNHINVKTDNLVKIGAGIYQGNEILATAIDKANFTAKIAESTFRFFTEDIYQQMLNQSKLELYFDKALADNEFELYLQPKINMISNEVIGAEALSRWNYNHSELLSPKDYIPILEANHKIKMLDYFVFKKVCEFQRKCIDNGYKVVPISVNASRFQENYRSYIVTINNLRTLYNLPANLFEIEITEGMFVDNIDQIKEFITDLHKSGYYVSMDDFGSGYSNFSSLADLDVDIIKLDQKFISRKDNEKFKAIIKTIVSLSEELNIDVICEGVENETYRDFLVSIGCIKAQGFLYDKPLPNDDYLNKYLKTK